MKGLHSMPGTQMPTRDWVCPQAKTNKQNPKFKKKLNTIDLEIQYVKEVTVYGRNVQKSPNPCVEEREQC